MRFPLKALAAGVLAGALLSSSAPASADINPNLYNGSPSASQPLWYSGTHHNPQTMSNQGNIVIARGYGMCVRYGSRFDFVVAAGGYRAETHTTAFALIQVDDGACTGPIINTPITVVTTPWMPKKAAYWGDPNAGLPARRSGCEAGHTIIGNGFVSVSMTAGWADCTPTVHNGGYYVWPDTGWYNQDTRVYVNGASFSHVPVSHQLY